MNIIATRGSGRHERLLQKSAKHHILRLEFDWWRCGEVVNWNFPNPLSVAMVVLIAGMLGRQKVASVGVTTEEL